GDGEDCKRGDNAVAHASLAPPLALGAAEDVVRGNAKQPGDDLGESQSLAVALLARIGREQLDFALADAALGVELEIEGRGKAFELRVVRLAGDDERDDRPLGVARLEEADLLVDILALGRSG